MRAFGIGALCAVIGALAAAFAASVYGDAYLVSRSDIGWGFVVLLVWIPAGVLAGVISGAFGAHVGRNRGSDDLVWSVAIGSGTTLALIGGVTGVLVALAPARPKPVVIAPRWLHVEYQMRLPAGEALIGAASKWTVAMRTPPDYERVAMPIAWQDAAMIDGRAVIPASGYVHGAAPRAEMITQSGEVDRMTGANPEWKFSITLPADATEPTREWSEWQVFSDGREFRTRVQFRAPP